MISTFLDPAAIVAAKSFLLPIVGLVPTVGLGAVMEQLLAAPAIATPTHMGIGTGATAEASGDTTLQTQVARVALTSKTRAGAVVTFVGDFPAGTGTGAITETGIFNASANGTLYCRLTFPVKNKSATDSLQITITFTLTAN